MPSADTSIDAARRQREVLASKTPGERAAMAIEMSELLRQLVIDGIRLRNPAITPGELTCVLIERLHGREVAAAVAVSRMKADAG